MSISLVLQYAVVAAIVSVSVLQVIRKLAPSLVSPLLLRLSIWLGQSKRSRIFRWLGQWIQRQSNSSGCSDGCSACKGCSSGPAPIAEDEIAVKSIRIHVERGQQQTRLNNL